MNTMQEKEGISTAQACIEMGGINRVTFLRHMRDLERRAINHNEDCMRQPPLRWTREDVEAAKEYVRSKANKFWTKSA